MNTITEYRLMYQIWGREQWRCAISNTTLEGAQAQMVKIQARPVGAETNWTFRIESRTVTTSDWEVVG